MAKNIHAGHGKQDSKSCGAVGIIKESVENRIVKDKLIQLLRAENETIYDCTVDYPASARDCINKIVSKCNAHKVDLDVSIHFNSGAGDKAGNGRTTGVEVLVYRLGGEAEKVGKRICAEVAKLGFKNRGVKVRSDLGYLKGTKYPAMIVECCFVDDRDDCSLYNANEMSKAIARGILGRELSSPPTVQEHLFAVCVGAYSRENANKMLNEVKSKGYKDAYLIPGRKNS